MKETQRNLDNLLPSNKSFHSRQPWRLDCAPGVAIVAQPILRGSVTGVHKIGPPFQRSLLTESQPQPCSSVVIKAA